MRGVLVDSWSMPTSSTCGYGAAVGAAQSIKSEPVAPTAWSPKFTRIGNLCISALLMMLICSQSALSAGGSGKTLHYTSGGPGVAIASAGFDLADVQSVEQLNALPPGMKGLIWLNESSGVTPRFIAKVRPFIGNPRLFGFRLCDEPDITGKYHSPAVSPAALKAETEWIRANVPGAVTFVTLMDMGSFEAPAFMNTFNPANTGIDLFGLDPYPVRGKAFDLDFIDRTVEAAVAAGIPLDRIVPVYQAFGGGNWKTRTGAAADVYVLPTPDQAKQIFARWATYSPAPVFDFAYAWGSQNGDTKLGSASPEALELRLAFKAHNTAP